MSLHAVKQITLKEILKGKPDRIAIKVPDPDNPGEMKDGFTVSKAPVAVVMGTVHDFEVGTTQYGNYVRFIGRFEASRIKDGEVFQSTRMILPDIAGDITRMNFLDAKAQDDMALLDIAFILGVEPDSRGTEGYKWSVNPVSTGENLRDPLAELRAKISGEIGGLLGADKAKALGYNGSQPALEAPKETEGDHSHMIEPNKEPAPAQTGRGGRRNQVSGSTSQETEDVSTAEN